MKTILWYVWYMIYDMIYNMIYNTIYDMILYMIWYYIWYDMIRYDIWYDIFVNCNWVDTRWQQYSTHLNTNNTQNNTINSGRVRAVPRLCELYPAIYLTTEEKARKNLSQDSWRVPVGTTKTEYTKQSIHNNKNT
jgi:hypothetical protein